MKMSDVVSRNSRIPVQQPAKWGHKKADELQARADAETDPRKKQRWLDRIDSLLGKGGLRGRLVKPVFTSRSRTRAKAAKDRALKKRIAKVISLSPLLQAFNANMGKEGSLISRVVGSTERTKDEEEKRQLEAGERLYRKEERRLVKAGVLPERIER